MRVVVLGAGSLGSLYAAWSADAGHDVCIVARTAHAVAVDRNGLRVREPDGQEQVVRIDAVDDVAEAPDADVVLLASKANDSEALLAGYQGSPTAAWSVQNGVRQADPLNRRFGPAAIGCSSMVGATLIEPGIVAHTFSGATYLGALTASSATAVPSIRDSLAGAAGVVERNDIVSVLWSKAVLAAGAMGMSVVLRLPYHHVFIEPPAREVFYDIIRDAATVALAEGVELVDLPGPLQAASLVGLERSDAVDRLREVGDRMVAAGQTAVRVSMLQSLESSRRLEVKAVFGDLIEIADRHQLDVPVLRAVTGVVTTLDDIVGRAAYRVAADLANSERASR